jgi:hypothetical protein
LVGRDLQKLRSSAQEILLRKRSLQEERKPLPFWDGHAAERIARIIVRGSTV